MEFIGIILTGTIVGALLFGAFWFGYIYGQNHSDKEGLTVTKENQDNIEEMLKWRNFDGRN
ncbi:MAG: hypothetical protein KBT03_06875 [Bacteroidales bacterium]|nr:hypothetical protein [Candidatus Scybalousia scybalohippi]